MADFILANLIPSKISRYTVFKILYSKLFYSLGILIPSVCVPDLTATLERIALQAAGTADENPTTNVE